MIHGKKEANNMINKGRWRVVTDKDGDTVISQEEFSSGISALFRRGGGGGSRGGGGGYGRRGKDTRPERPQRPEPADG